MEIPGIRKVKSHFKQAKEVRCLLNNIVIGITSIREYVFNEADNTWTSSGCAVTLWKDGTFAEIVTKKKCACKSCNCKEKQKLVKRKPNTEK